MGRNVLKPKTLPQGNFMNTRQLRVYCLEELHGFDTKGVWNYGLWVMGDGLIIIHNP